MRIFVFVLTGMALASACLGASVTIVTDDKSPYLERLAAKELQKYIYACSGELLPIAAQAKGDAIAVGTPASSSLVRRLKPELSDLGDQGYLLRTAKDGERTVLLVTGNTPIAVLYGAYSLLEEYGFGFYLGGDAIPEKKPFSLVNLDVSRKPAFRIRGTLPWYNFFDSPTAWDFEDYAWFFDQLVKTKNNFIGFHSYDFEPFAAYPKDGKYVYGEPLQSTANPCWGTTPMKTREFGGNTSKYFGDEYFGAGPSLYQKNRERSIRDAQTLLSRALDYGKKRGLKVCLGFEVTGADPTDPEELERLEARLRHLIAAYPMLDYVWIWESEGKAIWPGQPPALDSHLGSYYRRFENEFAYLENPAKIGEAIRLAVYTIAAHRILSEIAPQVRLVLSGWGGDRHLHVSDFYPGLDKVVPKDVIFSALDNIVVSPTVSEAYGKLSPERERWPIPWFEYDGDQWFPQPNANTWGEACRDALAKGSQGILGIHWRTRDVEESHAYMSQLAWNTGLTFEQFYEGYAARCFGKEQAKTMTSILMGLQSLGYRWVGGHGQPECGRFSWNAGAEPAKMQRLTELLDQLREVYAALISRPGFERQAERAAYFIATADWALRYEQTAALLNGGGEVRRMLNEARSLKEAGKVAQASILAEAALEKLHSARFDLALDTLATRLTNKGELGILATVNAKAYVDYRAVEGELGAMTGGTGVRSKLDESDRVTPLVTISPINPNTMWTAGSTMPVKVVTQGEARVVRAVWRRIGAVSTQYVKLRRAAPRYFEGGIACPSNAAGVEYAVEILDESGKVAERWPGRGLWHQVTLISAVQPSKYKTPPAENPLPVSDLTVRPGEGISLVVRWSGNSGAYEISRAKGEEQLQALRTVRDTWFEDRDVEVGESYRYAVVSLDRGVRGQVAVSSPQSPNALAVAPPSVTPIELPGRVRLRWPRSPIGVAGYLVYRAASPSGPWELLTREGPKQAENWRDNVFATPAQPGAQMHYKVTAVDRAGVELASSNPVRCTAKPGSGEEPVFALHLTNEPKEGRLVAPAVIERVNEVDVAHFSNGGHIAVPHRAELDTGEEITVSLWAKLIAPGNMPVLLSHGQWDVDGYFVQVLGGQARFYLGGVGVVDAGRIEPGKWYHIAGTYDGSEITVYLNGQRVGRTYANGAIAPCGRTLYIGRYELADPAYETNCMITGVKIYPTALLAEDIRKEYERLADKLQ